MIKKLSIIIAIIWFAFLAVLVFKEQILGFLGQTKEEEKVVQGMAPPVVDRPPLQAPVSPPVIPVKPETIPFAPLPNLPPSVPQKEIVKKPGNNALPVDEMTAPPANLQAKKQLDSFGLICTKFERVPSRFRLVSWDKTKKVELEDLSQVDPVTQKHPRFWLNIRTPYKEFIHRNSKESFFRPTTMNDPNKRIIAHSFEIKKKAIDYSSRMNSIGYLILHDFKIGGPPYQLTSEMETPLTSSYYLHFEQNMGPQKFFHDLTGKKNGYAFGGWGLEYKVIKQNFAQNKITVLKKDLKTGMVVEKDLYGPTAF